MEKKVILITGASSGIGKVTAIDLIKLGHIVYGAARDAKNMQDLKKVGGNPVRMDVTNDVDLKKCVNKIIKEQGKIDVLWNNAGFGLYGPVEEVSIDKARYQFEVNLFGLARLTQLVLPYMRKQKKGLIINTSSIGGKVYTPLGAWYHATKHALEGWSDCLRLEVKDFNINVVVLEPGFIETGFSAGVIKNFPQKSINGPYKHIIEPMIAAINKGRIKGSSPTLISETIQKIINSKNPKTRYLVGKMAFSVYLRRLLGDRIFDKMILKAFKW